MLEAEALSGGRPTVIRLLDEATRAMNDRDWTRLRSLYHPGARLTTVAGGGVFLGPDETIEALRRATLAPDYSASVTGAWALDDHAALFSGQVRSKREDGFIADQNYFWLHVERDRLMYRAAVFQSSRDAWHVYQDHGPTLGVPD